MRRRGAAQTAWLLVVAVILCAAGLGSAFFVAPPPVAPKVTNLEIGGKMQTTLRIQVYDSSGNLKSTMVKEDDLILDNFRTFLAEYFSDDTTLPVTASLKNDLNQAKTLNVRQAVASGVTNSISDTSTGSGKKGGVIGIGTGTTAPQRTDYKLETPTEADTDITDGYPTWSAASGNVTISASVAITGAHDVTEAVLGVNWVAADASENTINLFRDTFPAVTVANLDVMVITYQIQLTGDEFNSNFGNLLKQMFETIADGGTQSNTSYTNTSGTTRSFGFYNAGASVLTLVSAAVARIPTSIAVGTSNAAPTRTQYALTGQVELYTVPNPHPSTVAATTVVVQTDTVCSVQRDLQESGLFIEIYYVVGVANERFMFLRDTYTLEHIPSGNSIRITFTITC